MKNRILSKLLSGLFAAVMAIIMSNAAWAQASCGVQGSTSASPISYDPFNPSGLASTTITLTLTRVNTSGGGDTRVVNFYLKGQSAAADGTSIIPVSIAGSVSQTASAPSLGLNIFYNYTAANVPQVSPTGTMASGANRMMKINFTGGNTDSNTATVVFNVTLPANLNLNASASLGFDAFFGCNIQGGRDNGSEQQGTIPNAIVFPVTILSALQASYVGPILDFGEVGDKTTTQVQTAPTGEYTRTGDIRVASSGAYTISMTSANNYRLTFPGGNPATPQQSLAYNATLVGLTKTGISGAPLAGQTPITKICARAGVGGILLPVSVRLTEGGSAKTPASAYTDFLNVTVTPQIATVVGSPCP